MTEYAYVIMRDDGKYYRPDYVNKKQPIFVRSLWDCFRSSLWFCEDVIREYDLQNCRPVKVKISAAQTRLESMVDLFTHLITRNDDRSFNEVWDYYFKSYHEKFGIGKMNQEELKEWLLEEVEIVEEK